MVHFKLAARSVLFGITSVILAACLSGQTVQPADPVPISSDFTTVAIKREGVSPSTFVFLKVHDRYGYAEVCGAIVTSDTSSFSGIELNVRNNYFVQLEEDLVLNDLRLFNVVSPPQTPETAQANCISTTVIWKPEYDAAEPVLRPR